MPRKVHAQRQQDTTEAVKSGDFSNLKCGVNDAGKP
jgi:hypothetical protein